MLNSPLCPEARGGRFFNWLMHYEHRNWKQISKIYHWELPIVLLNLRRPDLWQQKTQNKVLESFFKTRSGFIFFQYKPCSPLLIWCNADRFSCARIRLFENLKSRLVTCIRVFIQTPSGKQKDTLWICANSKKISEKTINIDSIMQPVKSALP